MKTEEQYPNAVSKEDMMKDALKHYNEAAQAVNRWRSDIPNAILAYYSERPDPTETLRQELIKFFDWHYSGGGELNSGLIDQYLSETAKTRNESQPNSGVSTDANKELEQIAIDLAKWSEKYPRGRVYNAYRQPQMDGELITLEERAKEAVSKIEQLNPSPKQVKRKEEILKDNTKHTLNIVEDSPLHKAVMEAMEEYANQFKK